MKGIICFVWNPAIFSLQDARDCPANSGLRKNLLVFAYEQDWPQEMPMIWKESSEKGNKKCLVKSFAWRNDPSASQDS
jgi:hypothetical protein